MAEKKARTSLDDAFKSLPEPLRALASIDALVAAVLQYIDFREQPVLVAQTSTFWHRFQSKPLRIGPNVVFDHHCHALFRTDEGWALLWDKLIPPKARLEDVEIVVNLPSRADLVQQLASRTPRLRRLVCRARIDIVNPLLVESLEHLELDHAPNVVDALSTLPDGALSKLNVLVRWTSSADETKHWTRVAPNVVRIGLSQWSEACATWTQLEHVHIRQALPLGALATLTSERLRVVTLDARPNTSPDDTHALASWHTACPNLEEFTYLEFGWDNIMTSLLLSDTHRFPKLRVVGSRMASMLSTTMARLLVCAPVLACVRVNFVHPLSKWWGHHVSEDAYMAFLKRCTCIPGGSSFLASWPLNVRGPPGKRIPAETCVQLRTATIRYSAGNPPPRGMRGTWPHVQHLSLIDVDVVKWMQGASDAWSLTRLTLHARHADVVDVDTLVDEVIQCCGPTIQELDLVLTQWLEHLDVRATLRRLLRACPHLMTLSLVVPPADVVGVEALLQPVRDAFPGRVIRVNHAFL